MKLSLMVLCTYKYLKQTCHRYSDDVSLKYVCV